MASISELSLQKETSFSNKKRRTSQQSIVISDSWRNSQKLGQFQQFVEIWSGKNGQNNIHICRVVQSW